MNSGRWQAGSSRYLYLAFAVAFLGFSLVFLFFTSATFAKKTTLPAVMAEEPYRPAREDSITVLFMGISGGNSPGMYALVHFNPAAEEIPVAIFPPETVADNNGKPETLDEIYTYGGAAYTRDCLSAELGVAIERFVRLDADGFIEAADAVGGVEYSLSEDFTVRRGGAETLLRAGTQLLDGGKALSLLSSASGGTEEKLGRAGSLICSAINQRMDLFLSVASDGVFEKIINLVDSDIAYTDYHDRKEAAAYLAGSGRECAYYVPSSGAWEEDGTLFTPSDTFKARIRGAMG